MGTWGTDLFADDEAADIRDTLMQELRRTQSESAALKTALALFQPETDDECGYLFWIVTASIFWDYGRLTPELRDKALAAIDSGADELRWESAAEKDRLDRKKTMAAIRTKLRSEVPPQKGDPPDTGDSLPLEGGRPHSYESRQSNGHGSQLPGSDTL